MNDQEALRIMRDLADGSGYGPVEIRGEVAEAVDVAIDALAERAAARLLAPTTPEAEIDAELRAAGGDPVAIGQRGAEFVAGLVDPAPWDWRRQHANQAPTYDPAKVRELVATHEDFMRVRDELAAVLAAEHAQRKNRVNWLAPEIRAMADAVTSIRAARGLPPIDQDAVYKADLRAAGHSDYASRFALYCAELAVGMKGK